MQLSYNWLNSYIDIPETPEKFAHFLTMAGLEVEDMSYRGEGLEDLIVGEVLEVADHENADKLTICQVDCGSTTKKQIICGAPNVAVGQKVPVALPGTTLPTGLEIKETEIRGKKSAGMICSADELGLEEERQDGIMLLADNTTPGQSLVRALKLDDYVYKLDLTPNYARCLGHIGVAREVKGLSDNKLAINWPEALAEKDNSPASVEVEIKDPELCQRYTCRLIEDIEIKPSPLWMQRRLEAAGIRPINNIVDITNYVMLEYNQPLHAFDFDRVTGDKIIVRRAEEGEVLMTLDDKKRELDSEVLVIADKDKPIGLAGVMGGANTEVTTGTRRVLLEAASFNAVNIRRTAKKFALHSDSSHRFERKIDITAVDEASRRACYLLQKYAGGEIKEKLVDQYPAPFEEKEIELAPQRVNQLLGINITAEKIATMLEGLGFKIHDRKGNNLLVKTPGFRRDVEGEADLIEEVARVYGYNNISSTRPASSEPGGRTSEQKKEHKIDQLLQQQGLEEVINYSLRPKEEELDGYLLDYLINSSPGNLTQLTSQNLENLNQLQVRLKNPLSQAFAQLRVSLIPGLIEVLSLNARKQIKEMAIYEMGQVFYSQGKKERPLEKRKIALGSMGYPEESWGLAAPDFFYLKGSLENLLAEIKVADYSWQRTKVDLFHPGRAANLFIAGEKAGVLGELHPDLAAEYDLPARTALGEFAYDLIEAAADFAGIKYQKIPRHPSTSRDLALLLADEIPAADIISAIEETGGEILQEAKIFDLYQGEQIPSGQKSLALKMLYQARERTLQEEEVEEKVNQIITMLEEEFKAQIRGK